MIRKIVTVILVIFLLGGIANGNGNPPIEAEQKLNEAKTNFMNGDLNRSLELIDEYLQDYPPNASAWNLKGMIFLQNNLYKEAEESFLKAIALSPDDTRLYYNTGLATFHQADLLLAEEYFNKSLSDDFEIPEQYFYLGLTQYGLAKYADAINSFKKSIELFQGDPAVWLNLGNSYEQVREYNRAIIAYDEAIKLDPSFAKPWFLKGKIYLTHGEPEKASDSFQNYTHLEPDDDSGWFWYANSLRKTDKRDESLKAMQKAIFLNPDNQVYQEYVKIYDYGNISGIMYDNIVTPLPRWILVLAFSLMVIFSLIAVIRR